MNVVAGVGIGFLLAVLWFDLMFDVQVLGHPDAELPVDVRDSIAAYYRRVTTNARPMNRLVIVAMIATLGALIGEIVAGDVPAWVAWLSLVLASGAIGLAAARTVRNAVRLGSQRDEIREQSVLARAILRDHVASFAAMATVLILQLGFAR